MDAPTPSAAAAPRPLARRLAAPLGALAAATAAFAYVGAVDPNEPGHYPVCPLLNLTGLYCPGCGGLRSAHAVVHGDLSAALGANALAVLAYAVLAAVWTAWLTRAVRDRPPPRPLAPVWWWSLGGVMLVFSVVRNLPSGAALAP
ncbi:DUF2752 domain-containing protein [Streptomyces clavuligerus]|uniref:Putative membrane protein n=1 Tax=Streptomyces clavuligerus TaxID=1901 RepID=E2PZL7_STRCL|nr:DUF2752 domain-containing protein [Streptomyces clavuligerus]ANW20662.1 hypothetical protein BB341_21850 [Streptomyces clavuligerus]AXU15288.1 DUF2752 domain-containing protein [Streptomyces clavuligerus]EFG06326.1 Putative membrane protein [Streptomyces clavuligerus]MBY6305373.1 DUF2752 domain-containing protein [Streptomyces clavuligerus]QCS08064.1 DUF2752 domain-containing protein [Streptomyces clavuligerus]